MEVIKLIEYLNEIVENSQTVPLTGKAVVDKKEVLEVIEEIINYLPDEFKKSQWIVQEKERILKEAKAESNSIKKEGYELLRKEIENHDIIKEASIKAEEIISSARREAKNMRLSAKEYADEILCQLDNEVSKNGEKMLQSLTEESNNYIKAINADLSGISSIIRSNIKELRDTVK